jgi:GcrA cell cycle regulator
MTTKTKVKTVANIEVNDCRWPFGDPRAADFHFCGAPQKPGRPYCIAHCAMSFEAARVRQPSGALMLPVRRAA